MAMYLYTCNCTSKRIDLQKLETSMYTYMYTCIRDTIFKYTFILYSCNRHSIHTSIFYTLSMIHMHSVLTQFANEPSGNLKQNLIIIPTSFLINAYTNMYKQFPHFNWC